MIFKKANGETVVFRKFNPYHDARGRFSTSNGAASFTYAPGKSRAHDLAIQRAKKKAKDGGKYAGRYSDGTEKQLASAERNLARYIEQAKNAIASAKYMSGDSKKEHLAHHTASLKELTAQMEELQREKQRRTTKRKD